MEIVHPSREMLARLVRGDLALPRQLRLKKHVGSCATCQRRTCKLDQEAEAQDGLASYHAAMQRAAEGTFKFLEDLSREEKRAIQLLPVLLQGSIQERLKKIRTEPEFQALKLCQLLQKRCRAAWLDEPIKALELATMAVVVADYLNESRYGSAIVTDARAMAWADLGNSQRIACDLGKAELALRTADSLQRCVGDPLTESEILMFQASLRRTQGRFDECIGLLDRLIKICREGEDRHREGRALIAKGTAEGDRALYGTSGFHNTIRLLRRGLARIDTSADPELLLAVRHNILYFLAESGNPGKAHQLLQKDRHLYLEVGKRTHLAKLPWVEGIIAEGLGHLHESQEHLWKSRELHLDSQRFLDTACVSLRLGVVLARDGRRNEAKKLVKEVIPIFDSLGAPPEASAARLLYLRLR